MFCDAYPLNTSGGLVNNREPAAQKLFAGRFKLILEFFYT